MIGLRLQNSPNGDLNEFGGIRALAVYSALECGGALQANPSSGNVANASAVATLAAAAGRMNYATGLEITFSGATAASVVIATLTGALGGTMSFIIAVPAGVAVGGVPLTVEFNRPIQASALNIAMTLTLPALGAGNTNACVNLHGFSTEAS